MVVAALPDGCRNGIDGGGDGCRSGTDGGGAGVHHPKQILEGEEAAQAMGSGSVRMCRSDDRGFIPETEDAPLPYPDQKPDLVHFFPLSVIHLTRFRTQKCSMDENAKPWR